jgi:hypothetical protein
MMFFRTLPCWGFLCRPPSPFGVTLDASALYSFVGPRPDPFGSKALGLSALGVANIAAMFLFFDSHEREIDSSLPVWESGVKPSFAA